MTIADVDFDLLPEVFTEVQEHLPALEFDLHHLVQNPGSDELLSSAFRHMHTIKGDFSYCRAVPIVDFVHLLEGVMQSLRGRKFQCSALVAEALVQSMDQVQAMMDVLQQTHKFDTTPREVLMQEIQNLAQARSQDEADQAARGILLVMHDVHFGEPVIEVGTSEIAVENFSRAMAFGELLTDALGKRNPGWRGRAELQWQWVEALNMQYRHPCNPQSLKLAVYWHDAGMLALPDAFWQAPPPKPRTREWPLYAAHAEDAAVWLLTVAPDCAEAAQIIRQHHLGVNGQGVQALDYALPPHPGALMLACADQLYDRVAGLAGEDYRRGVLRALFDVNGGLETRFDAEVINAFDAVARTLSAPA